MLRDEGVEGVPTWAQNEWGSSEAPSVHASRYREIDRQLRAIAKKRASLDVEEARWLREAEQHQIWRKLGFSTALEYLEDVFGYAPRTAIDRLRVAKELGELPELEAELRNGTLPYSAVRELSRVVTHQTEAAWLARARGKNLRDIEELVAGHKKGDDPQTPKDPSLIKRKLLLELSPHRDALLEQCRRVAQDELGSPLDNAELIELLCSRFLEEPAPASGKPTRPAHRIVVHRCDDCGRGWQEGRGRLVPLDATELAFAECDAELVTADSIDGERHDGPPETEPGAPTVPKEIPRRIRKLVWTRDQGRCRVPGCRATRNLHIHHVIHRADGGDHDPSWMTLLCSGHHALHHAGLLAITGRAPDQLTFVRDGKPLVDARSSCERAEAKTLRDETQRSRFDDVVKIEQAKQALIQLGFKPRAAGKALNEVRGQVRASADVATLVQAVLRARSSDQPDRGEDVFLTAGQALVQLGYSSLIATAAVQAARVHVGEGAELQTVIKEALRRCGD